MSHNLPVENALLARAQQLAASNPAALPAFVRQHQLKVDPALFSFEKLETRDRFRAEGRRDALAVFEGLNGKRLRDEEAARDALTELHAGAADPLAGMTRDEKVAALESGATGLSTAERIEALERMGAIVEAIALERSTRGFFTSFASNSNNNEGQPQ